MAQVFKPRANAFARMILLGALIAVALTGGLVYAFVRTPYFTGVDVAPPQPVPFSHEHHVNGLGIDCRYCHTSVEDAASAGMPPTHTCMTCHSQVWTNAEMLEPVRQSLATDTPLRWTRVNDLPDFAYFNHSMHVQHGVGCDTCHGRIDRMPLVRKANTLSMQWCLECHRDPAPQLRPRDQVFNLNWQPPKDREALGQELVKAYHVDTSGRLTNCYTCHR